MTNAIDTLDEQGKYDVVTEQSIRKMVETFYGQIRDDALLGPVFNTALEGVWPEHLERMVDFWSTLLLGTKNFAGKVFSKHMAMEGITQEHFVRWLSLFRQTVNAMFRDPAATELLDIADRIAGSLQLGFFGERMVRI